MSSLKVPEPSHGSRPASLQRQPSVASASSAASGTDAESAYTLHEQDRRMLTTLGIPIHSNSDDRNKATASPSSAWRSVVVWMLVGLGILILTIFGYIRTLKRSKEEPQNDRPEQESESLPNGSKLVHALFISAILIETVLIGHLVVKLARFLVYRPFFKHEEACIAAHTSTSSADTEAFGEPPRPPSRFIQRIVGPPPPLRPPPSLPDYDAALRQGARQDARRQAAHLGVSAGRRGREQFGSGDPEDLEIERIKRLGGLPPTYRSDEMRKSHVVLKGSKPERRSSILSMFSNTTSADDEERPYTSTSRAGDGPSRIPSITGFVQRVMSVRSSTRAPNVPGSPGVRLGQVSPRTPSSAGGRSPQQAPARPSSVVTLEEKNEAENAASSLQQPAQLDGQEQSQASGSPGLPREALSVILSSPNFRSDHSGESSPVTPRSSQRQPEGIV